MVESTADLTLERKRLLAAVQKHPESWQQRLVFADWLEEHGEDALAFAYRWSGWHKRYPSNKNGWLWGFDPRMDWRRAGRDALPAMVYNALPRSYVGTIYATVEEAFEKLATALEAIRLIREPPGKGKAEKNDG